VSCVKNVTNGGKWGGKVNNGEHTGLTFSFIRLNKDDICQKMEGNTINLYTTDIKTHFIVCLFRIQQI